MIALGITILYISTIIPINTIAIMTLASSLIPITIIKSDMKTAISVYICTTIIGFFLVPINFILLYGCFFGVYGIVKFFLEKINQIVIEYILKLLFFNAILFVLIFLAKISFSFISSSIPTVIIILAAELVFILYDYSLSIIITYYIEKMHKK